jgi:hypothetical protein
MHFRRRRRRPQRDKLQCVRSLTNGQFFSFSFFLCLPFEPRKKKRIEPLNSARFTPDRWHFGDTNKFGNAARAIACKARHRHTKMDFFYGRTWYANRLMGNFFLSTLSRDKKCFARPFLEPTRKLCKLRAISPSYEEAQISFRHGAASIVVVVVAFGVQLSLAQLDEKSSR